MDRRSKEDMKEVVERKATEGKPGQAHTTFNPLEHERQLEMKKDRDRDREHKPVAPFLSSSVPNSAFKLRPVPPLSPSSLFPSVSLALILHLSYPISTKTLTSLTRLLQAVLSYFCTVQSPQPHLSYRILSTHCPLDTVHSLLQCPLLPASRTRLIPFRHLPSPPLVPSFFLIPHPVFVSVYTINDIPT